MSVKGEEKMHSAVVDNTNKRIVLRYAILREMGRRKTEQSYMKIVENTKVVYIRKTQWPNC